MKAEVDAKLRKEEIECRISELEICTNIVTNIGTTWCIFEAAAISNKLLWLSFTTKASITPTTVFSQMQFEQHQA